MRQYIAPLYVNVGALLAHPTPRLRHYPRWAHSAQFGAFGATAVSKEILKAITAAAAAGVPFQEIAERISLDPAAWATLLDNHRSCCPLARIASVVGLIDVPLENRGG